MSNFAEMYAHGTTLSCSGQRPEKHHPPVSHDATPTPIGNSSKNTARGQRYRERSTVQKLTPPGLGGAGATSVPIRKVIRSSPSRSRANAIVFRPDDDLIPTPARSARPRATASRSVRPRSSNRAQQANSSSTPTLTAEPPGRGWPPFRHPATDKPPFSRGISNVFGSLIAHLE